MTDIKIGDSCLLLASTNSRRMNAGDEVTVIDIGPAGKVEPLLLFIGPWKNHTVYVIKNKSVARAYALRRHLMKISPDPSIKFEAVRETLKGTV